MNKRILSSVLVFAMLISALPTQTLAYFRYVDDERQKIADSSLEIPIKDSDGNVSDLDYGSWEELYPYGAFVFGNYEAAINEGATDGTQTVTIPVYRLGGTKGRAEVTVRYDPAATKTAEDVDSYSYALSGRDDIIIEYENPQPIAKYQKLGAPHVKAGCAVSEKAAYDDDGNETSTTLYISEKANSYQWQFIEMNVTEKDGEEIYTLESDWTDLADGLMPEITVLNEDIISENSDGSMKMRDFRCIYRVGEEVYCTSTWFFGEEYAEEDEEILPEMPEDTPTEVEPSYSKLEIDEEFGSAAFTLVFAEDEWVKNIVITAIDDEIGELPELGLFTLIENNGGDIYHAASTLSLLVNDDDPLGESQIGFEVDSVEADQDGGSVSVKVIRTGELNYPVSVNYSTADLDAKAGKQYSPISGTLMFAGDVDEATITIPLIKESARDEILSFELILSDLKGGKGSASLSTESVVIGLSSSGNAKSITEGTNLATIIAGSSGEDVSGSITTGDPLIPEAGTHDGIQTAASESPDPAKYNDEEIVTRSYTYDKGLIFSRSDYSDSTKYWRDYERAVGTTSGEYASTMSIFSRFGTPKFTDSTAGEENAKKNFTASQSGITIQHNNDTSYSTLGFENAGLLYSKVNWSFDWPTIGVARADRSEKNYLYVLPQVNILANSLQRWDGEATTYFTDKSRSIYWSDSVDLNFDTTPFAIAFGLSLNKNGEAYTYDQENQKSLSNNDKKAGANGSSKLTLSKLTFTRRYFSSNTLGLTIHTANDADIGNDSSYAVLDESSSVYQSLRPEVTIVENAGGVTSNGQLYVGSKLRVSFTNTADYVIPQDGDISDYLYLTDQDGFVFHPEVERVSDSIYYVTLLWDGMGGFQSLLNRNYTLNVVMERRQQIYIDVTPSLVATDSDKYASAWNKFLWTNAPEGGGSINMRFADLTMNVTKPQSEDKLHFTGKTDAQSSYSKEWNLGGTAPTISTMPLVVNDSTTISNLQSINFGQDEDDVILFNGRSFKGNETIYLSQADLAMSRLTFYFYDSTCLSNQTDMNISISDTFLYFDVNGNGVIDGYYDETTGYFVLDTDENGKTIDISLGAISGDFDENTFQPIVDENGAVHQYFLKVRYSTSPRSLKPPVGAEATDTLRILPFFASTVTDGGRYSTLTKEQLSYRYVVAGYMRAEKDGTAYYDSSDGHPMYGEDATKYAMIDIPLGGDVSPVYKEYSETESKWIWKWSPNFWGQLLFPYENPAPISHDMNMTGGAVAIAGEEPEWKTVDGKRIQTLSKDGAAKVNGYLGSFTANSTFGLAVTEEPYVTENGQRVKKKLSGLSDISHDSLALGEVVALPNADYLSLAGGSGDPDSESGDTGGNSSMPEFEADLGITLPSTEFGLSDYAKIIMDGNSVGFSIGLPLLKYEKKFPGDNSNAQQGQTDPGQTQPTPDPGQGGTTNPPTSGSTSPGQTTTAPATPATGNPNSNSGGASAATPSTPGQTQNPTPPSSTTGSWTPARPNVPTTTAPNAGTPSTSGGTSGGTSGAEQGGGTSGGQSGQTTRAAANSTPAPASTTPPTPSLKEAFKEANGAMESLKKFVDTKGGSLKEAFNDGYNNAKGKEKGIASKKFEASFSVALVIMFEYNAIDNGYYFKSATIAASASVEFTLQYRFTFFPLLYIYLKTGIEVKVSTGFAVDRVAKEGNDAKSVKASAFTGIGVSIKEVGYDKLEQGEAIVLDTTLSQGDNKVTGLHLYMEGSFYMEVIEAENDSELIAKVESYVKNPKAFSDDLFSSGRLKSNGEDPVEVYFPKHDGRVMVILTALEDDSSISSAKEVNGAKSVVYWQGIKIEPSGFIEVGAGIGIDILKFELYLKVSLGLGFTFGSFDVKPQSYAPASFDSFSLSAAIGFRVVVLFFTYSMDLLGYYLNYDDGKWESKFAAVNGAVPLNARNGDFSDSLIHVEAPENNWYDVVVDGEEPMTRAYDPTDKNAHFQLSGYGTSGDGFRLIEGLGAGYTYKVFTVNGDSYLLYTRPTTASTSELVLSKVVVTGTSDTRLVNPLDANETHLVVDGDGTSDLDFAASVSGSTINVIWTSYSDTTIAQNVTDASKNTVVKTASLDLGDENATGFTDPEVISTAGVFTFSPLSTMSASIWAETTGVTTVETQKANLNKYLTANNSLVDKSGNAVTDIEKADATNPMNATAVYRWKYQTALDSLYGDGSKLVVKYGENRVEKSLGNERIENLASTETDDSIVIAYSTSKSVYVDKDGKETTNIDQTTDLANIKRLYLVEFDKATASFKVAKLLRTVIDFDKCDSSNIESATLKDGVYSNTGLTETSIDPYISNLRFTDAKYTNGSTETLFTFESNGNTYVITEADTANLLTGNAATITPIFTSGVVDTGTDVVIGSDNEGNLAIVYSAPVAGTTNTALFIAWWDVNEKAWGSPNILAMNHLQVKEDAEKYGLDASQTEKAYLGLETGNAEYDSYIESTASDSAKGAYDQFTFSNLSMTLIKVPVEEDGNLTTKDQLIVFTEGIYRNLTAADFTIDGVTQNTVVPVADSGSTGFYAVSFGAGKQGVGNESLYLYDNRFTAGTRLSGKLNFTNTGTVAIRASATEPAKVVLKATNGDETQIIAEWNLVESIRSGENVELDFMMNSPLTSDLKTGTIFTATITEDEKYIGETGGKAFTATTKTLLEVAEKTELGIESLTVEAVSADADSVKADFQLIVSNRGNKTAENVWVQLSYESGQNEDGTPIYSPLDITRSNITVNAPEPIPGLNRAIKMTTNDYSNGIIYIGNIDSGYQRLIGGQKTDSDSAPYGTLVIPKSAFDSSLKLRVEVFSDSSDTSMIEGLYSSTHSDEYSSLNNVRTLNVKHRTFFSAPSKITTALGNTLRLPISFTSTAKTSDISVREISDGSENWTSKLGILYYDSASGCIIAAPNSTGSGIIQLQDSATNTIYAIAFRATELGSGINIFKDDESFEFSGDWEFIEDSKGWAGEETSSLTPPMNNDLVKAKNDNASVTFKTLADTITLRFVGKVTISSDLDGFTEKTYDSTELRLAGNYPLVIDFNNPDGKTHNVTIKASSGTELDRYEATYGEYVDPIPSESGNPEIIWSRSFPETASIEIKEGEEPEKIELIAYVTDDLGLANVELRSSSGNATIGNIEKISENFWLVPVTVSGNGSFTIVATDISGNETKSNVNAFWYNEMTTSGAKSTAPDFGRDNVSFVKADGSEITGMLKRSEKAFIKIDYTLKEGETLTVNGTAVTGDRYEVSANGFYRVRVTAPDGTWSQTVMYMDKLEERAISAIASVDASTKRITVKVDSKQPIESVTAEGPDGSVTFTKLSDSEFYYDYRKSGDYTITITDGTNKETLSISIPKTIEKLEIVTKPKTTYSMGEEFDLTGTTLRVIYSDETTTELTDTSKMSVKHFDSSKKQKLTIGIAYEGIDLTASLDIEILFAGKVILLDVNDDAYGDGFYTEGETVNVDPGTRDGYAFVGWSASGITLADKTAKSFIMPDNSKSDEPDIILVANWKKLVSVTIINGARNATGEGIYKEGDEVTVWAGKDSRTFLIWRSNDIDIPEGTGDSFTFTMPGHDVTLTAVWLGLLPNIRTITFETNGGSSIRGFSALDGQKLDLSVYVPTKDGFEFTGWFTDKALTNKVETLTVSGNIVLYAGWCEIGSTEPITLPFEDVKIGDWFYDDVYYVFANGMMNGTSETTFSPDLETSRAMIVTILHRLEGTPEPLGEPTFTDVEKGSWYEKAVTWAAENGIVNGYGEGIFGPSDPVTREQLAAILYRYSNFKGIDTTVEAKDILKNFSDAHEISAYALDPMKWAVGRGLINGMTTTALAPTSTALRSQAAAIFHRFCEN